MACPTIYSLSDSELLTLNKNTLLVPLWLKPLRRFHNRHSNSMRLRKRWSLFGSGTGRDYGDASIVVSGAARRGGHRKWRNDVVYVASREHDPHTIDQVLEISGLDRTCSYPCGFREIHDDFYSAPAEERIYAQMHYLWFSSLISVASGLFRRCSLASKSLWRFASTQWRIWMGGHIPNPSFSFVYW